MCPINFRWEEMYTPTIPRSRSPTMRCIRLVIFLRSFSTLARLYQDLLSIKPRQHDIPPIQPRPRYSHLYCKWLSSCGIVSQLSVTTLLHGQAASNLPAVCGSTAAGAQVPYAGADLGGGGSLGALPHDPPSKT